MKNIIDALKRRYATKTFDTTKKISQENIDVLLESLRLSPSSFGLQPWKFIHVTTPEIREQLKNASRGQTKVTDASDLFIIAAKTNLQENDVDEYIQDIVQTRGIPADQLWELRGMMIGAITAKSPEELLTRNQKQVYIAMWVLLTSCAVMEIDACPMEGFDPKKYNEILGLDALGLTATGVIAVGYRSSEDTTAQLAKVRFSKAQVIIQK